MQSVSQTLRANYRFDLSRNLLSFLRS